MGVEEEGERGTVAGGGALSTFGTGRGVLSALPRTLGGLGEQLACQCIDSSATACNRDTAMVEVLESSQTSLGSVCG